MNAYTFDSLSVGMEERFEAAVTDEMMDAFLRSMRRREFLLIPFHLR